MSRPEFSEISAAALRAYLDRRREKDYLLLDVRQPMEYEMGHIPGATLIPFSEFEARLFSLPAGRDLIFYCRSGARSAVAASLAAEGEVTEKQIFSLAGGLFAWEGRTLAGFPKVQALDKGRSVSDLLYTAMDLEKGAWRFYRHLLDLFAGEPLAPTLEALFRAESAHAELLYRFWRFTVPAPAPFAAVFDQLGGNILEGGDSLDEMRRRLDDPGGDRCRDIIELALSIEYSAYDLYRSMADRIASAEAREALLSISQAEKGHMRTLSGAMELCR